jgi:hypothetical protein
LKGLEQFLYFPWAMIFGSSTTFVGLLTVAVRSDFQVSPLKRTSWNSVKLTALNLGDSFARWSFDVFVFRYRVKVADLVFEKQKMQNQPALDGSDQNQALAVGKDRCASATRPVLAIYRRANGKEARSVGFI